MSGKFTAGILLIPVFLFSACSALGAASQDEGVALNSSSAGEALATDIQLMTGSLLLEDSDLAIDNEEASTLLPYWQMYLLLSESDGAAQEELDAVTAEIQELMDPEQISYIAGLQLTQGSVNSLMQNLGLTEELTSEGVKSVDGGEASMPGDVPDGVAMVGGQAGAGAGLDMQVSLGSETEGTGASGGNGSQSTSSQPIALAKALITLLETRAGGG